jgi:helix-turn-helix protein
MGRSKGRRDTTGFYRDLGMRLRQTREELCGSDAAGWARRLGVPAETWSNYEAGCSVPAEVLLAFLELSGVEPTWLQHGSGPKFRPGVCASWSTRNARR